ncbi:hypothetical protein [Bacillus paranthracis]|uniref:hypothetical protein n=1 Tax=Bacillus paranthracis TaxID=2026186 RepID=UPI000D6D883E|nr:hypothetical protein [Bacillus paranthracis]PWN73298.1 hypothetical protein CV741_16995 [Bacillus cereus]PWN79069.1 hypothetical protein CV717_01215 [Bacillus cereus]UHJ49675.1 hypothetical protein LU294_21600 [Bacillus paranthracis]
MDLQLFEEMKERLGDAVKNGTGDKERFHVYAWEAGIGKSTHVNDSIIEHYNKFTFEEGVKKFLIVKKFKSDVYETVERLKNDSLLDMYGKDSIIGLTSENVKEYSIDDIKTCMVLIITHQRYIEACSKELATSFGERDTLIIDEQLQFPITKYGRAEYNDMRKDIHLYEGQVLFDKCFLPLLKKLDSVYKSGDYNNIVTFKDSFDKETLKDFKKWVKVNDNDFRKKKYKDIIEKIELLQKDESNGLIHNNTLYLIDQSKRFRKLKNNIILDASADITPLYKLEKQFKLVENRLCIDHSKSNMAYMKVNTSKSSLKKNLEAVIKDIQNRLRNLNDSDKRALVVSHKENAKELNNALGNTLKKGIYYPNEDENEEVMSFKAATDWYGNIVGKNLYKDYDLCFIVGTNNMPLPIYLLQFYQYSTGTDFSKLPDTMALEAGKFKIEKLETIRKAFVASDFYQAARRIQRNRNPKATYILYTFDEEVIEKFNSKFKNLMDVIELDNTSVIETNTSALEDKAEKILKYINDKYEVGEIVLKKDVSEALGIPSTNLSRCWKSKVIQNMVDRELIEIRHKEIVKKGAFEADEQLVNASI